MARVTVRDLVFTADDVHPPAGPPQGTVLFVHGHPFDRTMWRPQLAAVADAGWRVVAPDLRGYGTSDVTPGVVTLDAFADDLAGLLDALGVDAAVVVGLSMGGQIAMEFARRHPARLRGLVLAATFARLDSDEVRAQRIATADRVERDGLAGLADEVLARMLAPSSCATQPTLAATVHGMMRAAPPAGAAAALRGRARRSAYDAVLAAACVPALVVAGDEDVFTTRADVDRMATSLADAEVVWMPGVGHLPNLEAPQRFNDALLRLLDRVRSVA